MKLITLTRQELKKHQAKEYLEGTIIAVNKYRIHIKWGHLNSPRLTTVSTKYDFRDIPIEYLPYYILDFI